jgi:hypothetical protein
MLVVTDSEIATGNREVSDRGMFESRSLEGSCIGASKGLKPLPGSLRVPAILLLQHL